jgi:hypothetical protein
MSKEDLQLHTNVAFFHQRHLKDFLFQQTYTSTFHSELAHAASPTSLPKCLHSQNCFLQVCVRDKSIVTERMIQPRLNLYR